LAGFPDFGDAHVGVGDLSLPKIISGRIDGAIRPGWEWRQWRQTVGLLDARAYLSVMPSAGAPDCDMPHTKQKLAAGANDAPLVPTHDLIVYAVLEDFGKAGCAAENFPRPGNADKVFGTDNCLALFFEVKQKAITVAATRSILPQSDTANARRLGAAATAQCLLSGAKQTWRVSLDFQRQ
jgi:hypothetical protein